MNNVDPLSLTSVHIEVLYQSEKIADASGIIIKKFNRHFLVTNWHVITGKDQITKKLLSKKGAIPNFFRIWVQPNSKFPNDYKGLPIEMPLYGKEIETPEVKNKLWLEHPSGSDIDVILLSLDNVKSSIHTFNLELAEVPLLIPPSMPVSLIGFPYGQASFQKLPYWVTGFIASESNVDMHKLFINAPGRKGLSGAPVVSRQFGGFPDAYGNIFMNGAPRDRWIGIYSGRINEESDIGIIWKPQVIHEILNTLEPV